MWLLIETPRHLIDIRETHNKRIVARWEFAKENSATAAGLLEGNGIRGWKVCLPVCPPKLRLWATFVVFGPLVIIQVLSSLTRWPTITSCWYLIKYTQSQWASKWI